MPRAASGGDGGRMSENYDVIIIGSGAGRRARWRTPWPPRASGSCCWSGAISCPARLDNWDPKPVFVDGKYISKDTWFDRDGKSFQPQVHYFVGGATKMYGAALYRLRAAGLRRDQARRRDLPGLAAVL